MAREARNSRTCRGVRKGHIAAIVTVLWTVSSCSPNLALIGSTTLDTSTSTVPITSTSSTSFAESEEPIFKAESFTFSELPDEALPYAVATAVPTQDSGYPTDDEGIRLYERSGANYYHPVVMAQRGLILEAGYRVSGGVEQLQLAMAHARRLVAEADSFDGGLYFPYTFEFALHGREDAVLPAPWYSAMAQGQALSLFTRLYESTGEPWLLDAANSTFRTFRLLRNDGAEPWTVVVDDVGYLWLEEYPTPDADHHALNGHNSAAFGVYDYYMLTGEGLDVLRGALTTVLAYFDDFRNPGGPSFYELKFGVTSEKYHAIHIDQLEKFTEMTGDLRFADLAKLLVCDFSEEDLSQTGC